MTFTVAAAPPAGGNWKSVQHRSLFASASATTAPLAPASPLQAGNFVAVAVSWGDQGPAPTVTDTLGNTYTAAAAPVLYAGSRSIQIFYARNITGGATTITARFATTTGSRFIAVSEYSGIDRVTPLVSTAGGRAGSGTTGTVTVAPSAAGQLIFAANVNGAAGVTGLTGNAPLLLDSGSGGNLVDAHDTATGTASQALTFRFTQSGAWAVAAAVFRLG
jgi:hypothetical protein